MKIQVCGDFARAEKNDSPFIYFIWNKQFLLLIMTQCLDSNLIKRENSPIFNLVFLPIIVRYLLAGAKIGHDPSGSTYRSILYGY